MNETITVVDPGWDWAFTAAMSAPTVGALVLALIFFGIGKTIRGWRRKEAMLGWMQGFLWVALGTGVFLGLLGGGIGGQVRYTDSYEAAITEELEAAGFDNITLDSEDSKSQADAFTASFDGDYFAGKLVEDGTDTYIIVPLVGAK